MSTAHLRTIPRDERRNIRLEFFFAPYPHFKLKIDDDLEQPIVVKRARQRKNKVDETKYPCFSVAISPLLLGSEAPEWVEEAILKHSLLRAREELTTIDEKTTPPMENEYYGRIKSLFEKLRAKRAEFLKAVPESMSNEDLAELWLRIRKKFFPGREDLDSYSIRWANRKQTMSLASCNVDKKRVSVAAVLNTRDCYPYLEPLVYHEMCHAALGQPKTVRGRRVLHGKEFKALERLHPRIDELNRWISSGGWTQAVAEAAKNTAA